jgi:hypothetical protein
MVMARDVLRGHVYLGIGGTHTSIRGPLGGAVHAGEAIGNEVCVPDGLRQADKLAASANRRKP